MAPIARINSVSGFSLPIRVAAALAVLVLAGCGAGATTLAPPASPTIAPDAFALPDAPVVQAISGRATLSLSAQLDTRTGLPAFFYNGVAGVAPTIRVQPGDTIDMTVADGLQNDGSMSSELNVHFHGLQVSPNAPGDDVLDTLVPPGGVLHYVVAIPSNQPPGLYWYHPHTPGSTDYQVGRGGMSGAIVVEGLQQHFAALAPLRERVLVVREIAASATSQSQRMDGEAPHAPCAPKNDLRVTVNGVSQPHIDMAPGESQLLRVINATGHRHLDLAYDGGTLRPYAIDGVALDAYANTPAGAPTNDLVVPPAGRAEFVITAPTAGSAALRTRCFDAGAAGDADDEEVIASIRASSSQNTVAAKAFLHRSAALAHLAALPAPAAHRVVRLSEDDAGFYINGARFDMMGPPQFTVASGSVEEWDVVNLTREVHDFHMHQVHFLVTAMNGSPLPHPYWADTIVVPARTAGVNGSFLPGSARVIVDFRDPVVRGTFMFHCHILDHEDGGMMALVRVI